MARPTAADRTRDAIALVLLVGGAALFLYARARLGALAGGQITREQGHAAIEQAVRWDRVAGVALAALAAALRAARGRRELPPSDHT